MWQSFTAIGRGAAEETWRKKKKHHEHFISPPVTTYGRPNKNVFLKHEGHFEISVTIYNRNDKYNSNDNSKAKKA